jgi:hypothetical protein
MRRGERSRRAEFILALECCKWGFQASRGPLVVPAGVDWPRFARSVAFHRIEGLAAAFLGVNETDAPPEIRLALTKAAERIAARNLEAAADCKALRESFEADGIPLLFLKGLPVGALAYCNPLIKTAIDVDLLIDPADLRPAARLLREQGYRLIAPRESTDGAVLATWHRDWKESVWLKSGSGLQVDLHTRASDNPRLIPAINVHAPRQMVDIGNGVHLPTFARGELFAYLAVHGASSAWFRLKWIADLAGFLQGLSGDEVEHLYRRSQALGAGRAAGQALLLADDLFGTLAPVSGLRQLLIKHPAIRRLYLTALDLLIREPREPTDTALGSLPIRWAQFLLLPGPSYKLSELAGQVNRIWNRPPI